MSSQTTEITVDIASLNDDPVAVDDTLTINEDAAQTLFDVLANDTDVDGDILAVQEGSVRITETRTNRLQGTTAHDRQVPARWR